MYRDGLANAVASYDEEDVVFSFFHRIQLLHALLRLAPEAEKGTVVRRMLEAEPHRALDTIESGGVFVRDTRPPEDLAGLLGPEDLTPLLQSEFRDVRARASLLLGRVKRPAPRENPGLGTPRPQPFGR